MLDHNLRILLRDMIHKLNTIREVYGYTPVKPNIGNVSDKMLIERFGSGVDELVDDGYEYALSDDIVDFYNTIFPEDDGEIYVDEEHQSEYYVKALKILHHKQTADLIDFQSVNLSKILEITKDPKFARGNQGLHIRKNIKAQRTNIVANVTRYVLANLGAPHTRMLKELMKMYPEKTKAALETHLNNSRRYGFTMLAILFEERMHENERKIQKGDDNAKNN